MSSTVTNLFGNEIVSLFLSLSQENAVSKLIHRLLSRKKVTAVLSHSDHNRNEIISGLRKLQDVKVIDLDNDLSCIIPAAEVEHLVKLKNEDNYQFKLLFYPIAKRFYNTMIKYFGSQAKRLIFISDDYSLLEFLGLSQKKKIIHAVENKVVIEQMQKNKTQFVDVQQDSLKDIVNDFKKILRIK